MPVYPCAWPTCDAYVPRRGDHCAAHKGAASERQKRDREYSRFSRDPEHVKFYNSSAWARARATALALHPVCMRCEREFSVDVHHKIPLELCTAEQRTDQGNLEPLCVPCHNIEEKATA